MKSPKPRNKAQSKKLCAITMSRNHYRKLSASIYHHAKNVGIVGILAYPKNSQMSKKFVLQYTANFVIEMQNFVDFGLKF